MSTNVEKEGMQDMGVDLASSAGVMSLLGGLAGGASVVFANMNLQLRLNGLNINHPLKPRVASTRS